MEDILRMFNPWWIDEYQMEGIPRKSYLDRMAGRKDRKEVTFLVGMRRVGKTTLMKHFISDLLGNVDPFTILYVSLDHPNLRGRSILDIEKAFRDLHGHSMRKKVYLFLDEVHLHDGFEIELKALHDLEMSKIYASGSASIFLLEKGAYLTGRQHFIEVHPFDLHEYLDLKGISWNIHDPSPLINFAEKHVLEGGMPEYLRRGDPEYITDLVESILYKDILARNSLRNISGLMDLAQLISQSVGNSISRRKIGRILDISHSTVSDYLSFFVEIKMIDLVEREGKISERKVSPQKIYMTDTGMAGVISPSLNLGALVENRVYNELKKLKNKPRYWQDGKGEIDFVFDDHAIEVKYKDSIDEKDLKNLKDLRGYGNKIMISRSVNETRDGIRIIPLYKVLLDGL